MCETEMQLDGVLHARKDMNDVRRNEDARQVVGIDEEHKFVCKS